MVWQSERCQKAQTHGCTHSLRPSRSWSLSLLDTIRLRPTLVSPLRADRLVAFLFPVSCRSSVTLVSLLNPAKSSRAAFQETMTARPAVTVRQSDSTPGE